MPGLHCEGHGAFDLSQARCGQSECSILAQGQLARGPERLQVQEPGCHPPPSIFPITSTSFST